MTKSFPIGIAGRSPCFTTQLNWGSKQLCTSQGWTRYSGMPHTQSAPNVNPVSSHTHPPTHPAEQAADTKANLSSLPPRFITPPSPLIELRGVYQRAGRRNRPEACQGLARRSTAHAPRRDAQFHMYSVHTWQVTIPSAHGDG